MASVIFSDASGDLEIVISLYNYNYVLSVRNSKTKGYYFKDPLRLLPVREKNEEKALDETMLKHLGKLIMHEIKSNKTIFGRSRKTTEEIVKSLLQKLRSFTTRYQDKINELTLRHKTEIEALKEKQREELELVLTAMEDSLL